MIKSNSLQLGNFIRSAGAGTALTLLEVIELKKAGIIITLDKNRLHFGIFEDDAEPIPITEEFLLKNTKFQVDEDLSTEERKIFFIYRSTHTQFIRQNYPGQYILAFGEWDADGVLLKGVHHLQNIIANFIGEPLEIKF